MNPRHSIIHSWMSRRYPKPPYTRVGSSIFVAQHTLCGGDHIAFHSSPHRTLQREWGKLLHTEILKPRSVQYPKLFFVFLHYQDSVSGTVIALLGLMATRERERESAIPGCESCEGGPRPGVGALLFRCGLNEGGWKANIAMPSRSVPFHLE